MTTQIVAVVITEIIEIAMIGSGIIEDDINNNIKSRNNDDNN